ncbi:sugar ABC transporter permease [Paenibacillus psychroresistens]|uniref:Sugar ABC transporter permease n=1 Tax=Paenibacillus psychroresistens TaxID=1778678 RepID=A0A6B8RFF3_9BACL|nr:ABC transporter permease subunit [Paenibacillus psychroresistens]QGQ94454.1 sugar ABC transporter permease [Paenibacillus psychroresistens]
MVTKRSSKDMSLLLMAIPLILLTFVFFYLPIYGWIYAFFDYQPGVPLGDQHFAGIKYFQMLFENGNEFVNALKNTLTFSFLIFLCAPLPIILAIMVTEVRSKKVSKIIQTVTSLPNFISWILVFSIFFVFFSNGGFVNSTLDHLQLIDEPFSLMSDSDRVWLVQTLVYLWKNIGWSAIIYIAAIAGIDGELYDAAEIDGAGRMGKIRYITLPGIKPTFIVLLLISVGGMLNNGFEQYFVFSNPLIAEKIEVLDTYVYRVGLGNAQYAYATAVGIFKTIVSIILLFSVNALSKYMRKESIF